MYFNITTPNGRIMKLISADDEYSVCTDINDCALIHGGYTEDDITSLARKEAVLPTIPGYSYNAVIQHEGTKVFIMALRKIAKDEEIFFAHGRSVGAAHTFHYCDDFPLLPIQFILATAVLTLPRNTSHVINANVWCLFL